MTPRPKSLVEVAERVLSAGGGFLAELADFLDDLRIAPAAAALRDEPPRLPGKLERGAWMDAYLAASAEFLAAKHGLAKPAWAFDPSRSLDEPVFACRLKEGRVFLLKDAPAAFKSRNLFVSANALERV